MLNPTDVICTNEGVIFVCAINNSIHILDINGNLVKYICTTDSNIYNPHSIAMNKEGQLLICPFNYSYKNENSKIYVCTIADIT